MNLTFRKGTIDDVEQLLDLGLVSYGQHKHTMSKENWNTFNSNICNKDTFLILLDCSTCFVCVNENGKIGLHETWQWTSEDHSKGKSIIEEV